MLRVAEAPGGAGAHMVLEPLHRPPVKADHHLMVVDLRPELVEQQPPALHAAGWGGEEETVGLVEGVRAKLRGKRSKRS